MAGLFRPLGMSFAIDFRGLSPPRPSFLRRVRSPPLIAALPVHCSQHLKVHHPRSGLVHALSLAE